MIIVLIVLFVSSIIGARAFYLSKVTKGDKIVPNNISKSALLVLDIQNDTIGIKEYSNSNHLLENINSAIKYANKNNIDILYTKQEFSNPLDKLLSGGLYGKGNSGAELSQQLQILSSNIFEKERTDSFSNKKLENYLLENEITTIYIVGADACACVYKTALAGINRGYNVIILEDCIFSVNDKLYNNCLLYTSPSPRD